MKHKILTGIAILVIAAFTLAACGTPAPPDSPTADANAVYTQAAATVAFGLTQTAEKNPQATATTAPPTNTPTMTVPSATPGGAAVDPQATATLASGGAQPSATTASGTTPVPTATKAAGTSGVTTGDKAEWVSQSPVDNTKIQKSATFNVTYVLKNTGTTTWNKNYMLRYYGGEQMDSPKDLNLTQDVAPGESVELLFTLIAPSSKQTTHTIWVVTNADGVNFYYVDLKLEITD